MHTLRIFDAPEPIFTPFKSVLCMELTLKILSWGVCLPSKALYGVSAWKKCWVPSICDKTFMSMQ